MAEKEILCAYGVDFDAVAGWLGSYGGEDSPLDISRGLFAGEVGVPRLLDLFREFAIPVTWFVPGHSVETFPRAGGRDRRGRPRGRPARLQPRESDRDDAGPGRGGPRSLHRAARKADRCERPAGYVAPWWEFSAVTAELLLARGIEYDHSLMHDDFHPYYVRTGDTWTKIDYSKPAGHWMKPLVRGPGDGSRRNPRELASRRHGAAHVHEDGAEQPGVRKPESRRGDVARCVRLGLPQVRLRGLPHDHSPRRLRSAAGAVHARAAVRAHALEAGGALCHDA